MCHKYVFEGKKVYKTQIINDRGIHICKSMVAWYNFGNNETPQSSGLKGDQLVGKYYVIFEKKFNEEINSLQKDGYDKGSAIKSAPIMIKEGKGAFGMFGKKMLEVTAAPGEKKNPSVASKVTTKKALESYRGGKDSVEDTFADTFMRPQKNSALPVADQTRNIMLPIQKELQGIQLTLGDLSSQPNALDKHIEIGRAHV